MEKNLIKELIKQAEKTLRLAEIIDFDIDSRLLAEYVFGITKTQLYIHPDMETDEEAADKYRVLVERRASHIPLQHLTGTQEFMGMEFIVNENVLIPRQDTEILVEEVIRYIREQMRETKVLDMCTGSGCIAVSVDKMCDNAVVFGADISKKALEVARKNNEKHNGNVQFVQTDMFEKIEGKFDVIVSNPPYIETEEVKKLMPEVLEHEPTLALDGEADGLKFYRIICENLKKHLSEDGKVFFEIGYNQGESVPEILRQNGFHSIQVMKDFAGNDRVVTAKRNENIE